MNKTTIMKIMAYMLLSLLMSMSIAWAVTPGTATPTLYIMSTDGNQLVILVTCVSDEADGSIPNTEIGSITGAANADYWTHGYYLYEVWVEAGSPAPDAADLTITDETAAQLFYEANVVPASGVSEGVVSKSKMVNSKLTVDVDNQGTNDAEYNIYIKLAK
jgi:hypothetical protein